MELLQSHRAEMITIAVALVAVVGATAYYYYLTKKPKGHFFQPLTFSFSFFDFSKIHNASDRSSLALVNQC